MLYFSLSSPHPRSGRLSASPGDTLSPAPESALDWPVAQDDPPGSQGGALSSGRPSSHALSALERLSAAAHRVRRAPLGASTLSGGPCPVCPA